MPGVLDILGNLFNAAYVVGAMIKNMLWLRVSMIVGCLIEILYAYWYSPPIWLEIYWCALWLVVNSVQLIILVRERVSLKFDEDERWLYRTVFANFSELNFKKIMKLAQWRIFNPKDVLVEEGVVIEELMLVFHGNAIVESKGRNIAFIRNGNFVGEMSFISGSTTCAKVTAQSETRCLIWKRNDLVSLMQKHPEIEMGLKSVFNVDLLLKIQEKNS
jgi:hypothetical protein